MKEIKYIGKLFFLTFIVLWFYSCNSLKESLLWVDSKEIVSDEGGVARRYLAVSKTADLKNPKWEILKEKIDGFVFEKGILQRIVIKKQFAKGQKKYSLVKVIEKQKDNKSLLTGRWILKSIRKNNELIDSLDKYPFLLFDLDQMSVFGNDGCNDISFSITEMENDRIHFEDFVSTRMRCDENIDMITHFNMMLKNVNYYRIETNTLFLSGDKSEKNVLILERE